MLSVFEGFAIMKRIHSNIVLQSNINKKHMCTHAAWVYYKLEYIEMNCWGSHPWTTDMGRITSFQPHQSEYRILNNYHVHVWHILNCLILLFYFNYVQGCVYKIDNAKLLFYCGLYTDTYSLCLSILYFLCTVYMYVQVHQQKGSHQTTDMGPTTFLLGP